MYWVDGTGDPKARADEAVKTVASLLAGGVRPVIWLPLAFDPGGRHGGEPRYGLLDPDGSVRPAGDAIRAMASAAGRGGSVREVRAASVSGVAVGGADSTMLVLWSDRQATVAAPPGEGATARTVGGERLSWDGNGLRLGSEPVLLTVPTGLDRAVRLVG